MCALLAMPTASLSLVVLPPLIEPTLTPSEFAAFNDPSFQEYQSNFINSMPNASTAGADEPVVCGLVPVEQLAKFYLLNSE